MNGGKKAKHMISIDGFIAIRILFYPHLNTFSPVASTVSSPSNQGQATYTA